ncbi:MAG: LemA family protein [Melioribacteraceae bacterium]|nr:LemA family protein [Melioribacteraceae bacterium]MCF8266004.1 LemA family protein [Melioribacteraceae bacterium]MCF8414154.1 LemA family protein [Melioribacteraceae bacterium]
MKKGTIIALVVAAILLIGVFSMYSWYKNTYNGFVTMNEGVTSAWSQVENQYQRRYDLIPNLVNTVKGAAEFEKGTFTAVTEARAKVGQIQINANDLGNPQLLQQFQAAQENLSGALSRLLVTVENYPTLKANENFLSLQAQLEGTENRISVERRKFNQAVQSYNTSIKLFPASIIAGMSGFSEKAYFQAAADAQQTPKVEF